MVNTRNASKLEDSGRHQRNYYKHKGNKMLPLGKSTIPIVWNLVFDDLIRSVNEQGMLTQGFADNIVIVIKGNFPRTVNAKSI